jgi:hypothetical protein
MDYEWAPGQSQQAINADQRPQRLAATLTAFISDSSRARLLLLNPHPDSWNNWQLPYESIVHDLPEPLPAHTVADIELAASQATNLGDPAVLREGAEQISKLLGGSTITLQPSPVLETFALRYSKTANVWTAYRFAYLMASAHDAQASVASTWLDLDLSALTAILDTNQLEGLPLSDNVATILRDPVSRTKIIDALASAPAE